ncbi:MAG: DoxX family protein [bacterium]|nr:DoxX family protein [bacterium]
MHLGLLILRLGLGGTFILHGWPKLMGGIQTWKWLGSSMTTFGITFYPEFWGFLAACTEFFGAILILLGLFTKQAAFFLFIVMFVAVSMHISKNDNFNQSSHAIELGIVFLSLLFTGAGKYSIDNIR